MADYEYLTATGLIVPDTSELRARVEAEWKDAFGVDLVVSPKTPQGVQITAEVLARDKMVRNNAAVANQINPNEAGGIFLDGIWALTGGERLKATPSVIPVVNLAGVPGVLVPAGSQASVGIGGAIFASVGDVVFDAGGVASVAFQSLDVGPVGAPIGELTQIVSGVLGWETVTNPTAAEPGLTRESDVASRARRRNTLALQGTSLAEAITSAVWDVPGVTSVGFRENRTGGPLVIDGAALVEHSIFVNVQGGTDLAIATAILEAKSGGCDYNGSVSVDVIEPASGQTYPVQFERPEMVDVFAKIKVRAATAGAVTPAAIRDVVEAYAAGLITGEAGLGIGDDVSAFEIASAVNTTIAGLYIPEVLIGTDPGALTAAPVPIDITQQASLPGGNIAVEFV